MEDKDIDLGLIGKIIMDDGYATALKKGIKEKHIDGISKDIWKFIQVFYQKHGKVPSSVAVKAEFNLDIPNESTPIEHWSEKILDRSLSRDLSDLGTEVSLLTIEDKPRDALELLRKFLKIQDQEGMTDFELIDVFALTDSIKQKYLDAESGIRGIPTPWPSMDEWTMGWFPGDISFCVARSGVGKSFWAIMVALKAHVAGRKVLFISAEMTKEDIAQRLYAIKTQIQYAAIRKGKLGTFNREKFFEQLTELRNHKGIDILEHQKGLTSVDIDIAMDRSNADIVIIDSCYRVKAGGKNRFDNMAEVVEDFKTYAQRHKMPLIGTTQLNREATKTKGKVGTEHLALSDVIGWNATNIFALSQNKEQKQDGRMHIHPLKVREGETSGDPLEINWDMVNMDFSEIGDFEKPGNGESRGNMNFYDDDNF